MVRFFANLSDNNDDLGQLALRPIGQAVHVALVHRQRPRGEVQRVVLQPPAAGAPDVHRHAGVLPGEAPGRVVAHFIEVLGRLQELGHDRHRL